MSGAPSPREPRDVVACVLVDGKGHLLVGRRPREKRHGGLWEFPGGKMRSGESLAEAAARELLEELGLQEVVTEPDVLFEQVDPGSVFRILFVRVVTDEVPRALEHEALEWLDPTAGAQMVPPLEGLAPVDQAFVRRVQEGRISV